MDKMENFHLVNNLLHSVESITFKMKLDLHYRSLQDIHTSIMRILIYIIFIFSSHLKDGVNWIFISLFWHWSFKCWLTLCSSYDANKIVFTSEAPDITTQGQGALNVFNNQNYIFSPITIVWYYQALYWLILFSTESWLSHKVKQHFNGKFQLQLHLKNFF